MASGAHVGLPLRTHGHMGQSELFLVRFCTDPEKVLSLSPGRCQPGVPTQILELREVWRAEGNPSTPPLLEILVAKV